MLGKIVLSCEDLNHAGVDPSRCTQKYSAMEGSQRKGRHEGTAFTSPGRVWEHSCPATGSLRCPAVCPSVTHPSTILLNSHSPMEALPSCAGGGFRARASCSSTKQDQRRRRIHRKPQPDLTSPRAFPAASGKQQQTFCFCSPDQVTLAGHNCKALHGAHSTIRPVPETTAISPSDFSRQKVCAAPRKLFLCPSQKSGAS